MNEEQLVEQVSKDILGKRVRVKIQARDNFGKLTNQMTHIVGTLNFLGFGLWGLQATVDRFPTKLKSLHDVEIVD